MTVNLLRGLLGSSIGIFLGLTVVPIKLFVIIGLWAAMLSSSPFCVTLSKAILMKTQDEHAKLKAFMIKEEILIRRKSIMWLDLPMLSYKIKSFFYKYWLFRLCMKEPQLPDTSIDLSDGTADEFRSPLARKIKNFSTFSPSGVMTPKLESELRSSTNSAAVIESTITAYKFEENGGKV